MLSKEERLFHSLRGFKRILDGLNVEDIKNEIRLKDGTKETIDCYNELDKFIIHFIKVQYKFGKMDIMILLNSILDIDSKSENKCFPVIKKFRILTDEDYDKLHNYENPQPYKFEELHEGMWVWDEKNMDFYYICEKLINKDGTKIVANENNYRLFEENRLFPITKALQYQDDE